ncbi:hypothetical protein AB5I41_13800 [Sphingomonas sp. MMS24-JH45]
MLAGLPVYDAMRVAVAMQPDRADLDAALRLIAGPPRCCRR